MKKQSLNEINKQTMEREKLCNAIINILFDFRANNLDIVEAARKITDILEAEIKKAQKKIKH